MNKEEILSNSLEDIKYLSNKFEFIYKQGWIKSKYNGSAGIGRTFEDLLGLGENSLQIPDFGNVEVKTHFTKSNKSLSLFKATFDNTFFEVKRIVNAYGYRDKILRNCKVLHGEVNGKHSVFIGVHYQFFLYVDWNTQKVYLLVYDKYDHLVDSRTYWTFSLLKERLYSKLTLLAYVEADRRYTGGSQYFYYKKIEFYRLRGFHTFLKLIESGHVTVKMCYGVFRSGKRVGQIHDHGTCFAIKSENLGLLFEKYEE